MKFSTSVLIAALTAFTTFTPTVSAVPTGYNSWPFAELWKDLIKIAHKDIKKLQQAPKKTLAQFTAPLSNGTASLTAPSGMKLAALTIGRGVQNYTCASADAAPVAAGAVATLFDASALLPFLGRSGNAQQQINHAPAIMLGWSLDLLHKMRAPVAGHHYFDATKVPTFDMTPKKMGVLKAAKMGDILAPTNQKKLGANGNVDWLMLDSNSAPGSSGTLRRVYRTYTAAGAPPKSCQGMGQTFSVQYAAQYYLYQ